MQQTANVLLTFFIGHILALKAHAQQGFGNGNDVTCNVIPSCVWFIHWVSTKGGRLGKRADHHLLRFRSGCLPFSSLCPDVRSCVSFILQSAGYSKRIKVHSASFKSKQNSLNLHRRNCGSWKCHWHLCVFGRRGRSRGESQYPSVGNLSYKSILQRCQFKNRPPSFNLHKCFL